MARGDQLGRQWKIIQTPIPLNLTELMALYFSRNMMKVLKSTIFFDPLESFFKKIKTMLPTEYIRYLDQFEKSIAVGQTPYKPYGQFREIMDVVNQATLQKKYLEMDYYTMSRKKKARTGLILKWNAPIHSPLSGVILGLSLSVSMNRKG